MSFNSNNNKNNKQPNYFLFPQPDGIKPTYHSIICVDTENDPNTGEFILGAVYGYYSDHHGKEHLAERVFFDRFELMKYLKEIADKGGKNNINYWLGFFNAAYDVYYIRELINDTTRITVSGRLITARLKVGGQKGIPIYDATNLVRGSLEKWIKNLDMEEKYGIKKLPLEQLKDRCLMDAKATYHLFKWLEDVFVKGFDIPMKLTIGSEALTLFQRKYLKIKLYRYKKEYNDYERKAYRGGRVEVFKRGKHFVRSFDVNSMYLSLMRDLNIPLPQSAIKHNDGKDFNINKVKAAIVKCRVFVPNQVVAPLPYYDENRKKLLFPCGFLDGYWTSLELKESLKYGVRIIKVYDYIEYTKLYPLFRDYADFIWKKRQENKGKGDSNLDYLYKTLGNSLYGKFGEMRRGGDWIKLEDLSGGDGDGDSGKDNTGDCDIVGALIKELITGEKYVYIKKNNEEEDSDSKHTFPIIAVWITSAARIKLLREMKKYEMDIVYCDTDSIKIRATATSFPKDSKELGGWGFEYEGEEVYYRPKLYGTKRKGIPNDAKLIKEDKEYEEYQFNQPIKRATSIRRCLPQNKWIKQVKKISKKDDKREWLNDEESYPLWIDDRNKD